MKITKHTNTHPVTQALQTAFDSGLIGPELQYALETEMKDLVRESAQKFVNTQSIRSLKEALNIVLGILSLSIMRTTEGRIEPAQWATIITTQGFKKIAEDIILFIKQITRTINGRNDLALIKQPSTITARQLLLFFATFTRNNRWSGYSEMMSYITTGEEEAITRELVLWLISNLSKLKFEQWVAINRSADDHIENVVSEHILNNLLFRHCCKLPTDSVCILTRKDFGSVRTKYERSPAKWVSEARHRYNTLVETIPADLRRILMFTTPSNKKKKNWFDRLLAKGPPSLPTSKYLDPQGKFQAYYV